MVHHVEPFSPRAGGTGCEPGGGDAVVTGDFQRAFQPAAQGAGHLFQGRYKSLLVDPAGLGALCHYIHLNPALAGVCLVEKLAEWPWTSAVWLLNPKERGGGLV